MSPPPIKDTATLSRIIEMAWEDRTPFEVIHALYGLSEKEVIKIMRSQLKSKSFCNWRARVSGRKTKHASLTNSARSKLCARTQYKIHHGRKPKAKHQ